MRPLFLLSCLCLLDILRTCLVFGSRLQVIRGRGGAMIFLLLKVSITGRSVGLRARLLRACLLACSMRLPPPGQLARLSSIGSSAPAAAGTMRRITRPAAIVAKQAWTAQTSPNPRFPAYQKSPYQSSTKGPFQAISSHFARFRARSSSGLDFQAAHDCNRSSPNTGSPMRLRPVSKTEPQHSGLDASRRTTLSSRCLKVEQKGAPTC